MWVGFPHTHLPVPCLSLPEVLDPLFLFSAKGPLSIQSVIDFSGGSVDIERQGADSESSDVGPSRRHGLSRRSLTSGCRSEVFPSSAGSVLLAFR